MNPQSIDLKRRVKDITVRDLSALAKIDRTKLTHVLNGFSPEEEARLLEVLK